MHIFSNFYFHDNTLFKGKVWNEVPHRTNADNTKLPSKQPINAIDEKDYIANLSYVDFWATVEATDIPTIGAIPSVEILPWLREESLVGKKVKDLLIEVICPEVHPIYVPGEILNIECEKTYYAAVNQEVEVFVTHESNDSQRITAIKVEYQDAVGNDKVVNIPTTAIISVIKGRNSLKFTDSFAPGKNLIKVTYTFDSIPATKKTNWNNSEPVPAPYNARYTREITVLVTNELPIMYKSGVDTASSIIVSEIFPSFTNILKYDSENFMVHMQCEANDTEFVAYIPDEISANFIRTISINDAFDITPSFEAEPVLLQFTNAGPIYQYLKYSQHIPALGYDDSTIYTLRQSKRS